MYNVGPVTYKNQSKLQYLTNTKDEHTNYFNSNNKLENKIVYKHLIQEKRSSL